MCEDDSGLLLSNQLVGNDQPIQGVIHRGQLALVWLEVVGASEQPRPVRLIDPVKAAGAQPTPHRLVEASALVVATTGFPAKCRSPSRIDPLAKGLHAKLLRGGPCPAVRIDAPAQRAIARAADQRSR